MNGAFNVDDLDSILLQILDVVAPGVPDRQFILFNMHEFNLAPETPFSKNSGIAIAVTFVLPCVWEKAGPSKTNASTIAPYDPAL